MNIAPDEAREALPGPLPAGERVIWAARPTMRALLRHTFRLRIVLIACGLLALWPVLAAIDAGYTPLGAAPAALLFVPFAVPLGVFIALAARTVARHTLYIVTDRRVILHVGYVFTRTINIPLPAVKSVALRAHADGTGDIELGIGPQAQVGYFALLPHVCLTRFGRPTPLLRTVPQADEAAGAIVEALSTPQAGPHLAVAA